MSLSTRSVECVADFSHPEVAFYGDDLTGSIDVLLQYARSGWAGTLFLGTPSPDRLARVETPLVGIAGIARSLPTAELEREVGEALDAFVALGPSVVQYKACSTADSSPDVGNLGRVIELGRDRFGDAPVPMLFAQPDFGRFTLFGHHFASEAGVVYRLDRQPTMSTHPSTPMTESQLSRHLSAQTSLPLDELPFTTYKSAGAVAQFLQSTQAAAVVLDAFEDSQLTLLGDALWMLAARSSPSFMLGSGGLSAALARARPRTDPAAAGLDTPGTAATADAEAGPVLTVSGSRSPRTREQIEHARAHGWAVLPLPVGDESTNRASPPDIDSPAEVVGRALKVLASGTSVVLDADGVVVPSGSAAVTTIAEASARAITAALEAGLTRKVIVCGGDTSGHVAARVGVESVSIAANPVDNVVLCRVAAESAHVDGIEMLFKGGQVGPIDLLERVRGLG